MTTSRVVLLHKFDTCRKFGKVSSEETKACAKYNKVKPFGAFGATSSGNKHNTCKDCLACPKEATSEQTKSYAKCNKVKPFSEFGALHMLGIDGSPKRRPYLHIKI